MNKYIFQVDFLSNGDNLTELITDFYSAARNIFFNNREIVHPALSTVIKCEANEQVIIRKEVKILKGAGEYDGELQTLFYECPVCKETGIAENYKFCPDCGTMIIWDNSEGGDK